MDSLLAAQPPHPPRLLEVHEVAFLFKSSQETVLRLIRKGKLAAIRLGDRSYRVDPIDLQAFIDAQRTHANGNGHGGPPAQGASA